MKLLLSPHSDDAILFATYTILREKLTVVTITHSTLQGGNGNERILEDYKAMKILGVPVIFLGIDEDILNEKILSEKLSMLGLSSEVWIPEIEENGNPQHNLISKVAKKLFWKCHTYKTYTGLEDRTIGKEIIPTDKELELKKRAMKCYVTQILNPMTSHYFSTNKEYE